MLSGETVVSEAFRVRAIAEAGPIGKRHSSFELYGLLAECMKLTERCIANPDDEKKIRGLVVQRPRGNRTYVEKGSDAYILVCRFVFSNLRSAKTERSNASRYAMALREASKHGLTSKTLAAHLSKNGGVNALFLRRPLERGDVITKCLVLVDTIRVKKGCPFTIKLQRTDDNRYAVLCHTENNDTEREWANG